MFCCLRLVLLSPLPHGITALATASPIGGAVTVWRSGSHPIEIFPGFTDNVLNIQKHIVPPPRGQCREVNSMAVGGKKKKIDIFFQAVNRRSQIKSRGRRHNNFAGLLAGSGEAGIALKLQRGNETKARLLRWKRSSLDFGWVRERKSMRPCDLQRPGRGQEAELPGAAQWAEPQT